MRRLALVLVCVPAVASAVKLRINPGPPRIKAAALVTSIDGAVKRPTRKPHEVIFVVTDPIDRTAVREQLTRRGYAVLIDRADQLVVEAKTHERITIRLTSKGGSVLVTATPLPQPALPGPCVEIPQLVYEVDVTSQDVNTTETTPRTNHVRLETQFDLDLDGDGIDDAFVPIAEPHACPESVSWRVMIVRGTCGHDLGVISPGSVSELIGGRGASGFAQIITTAQTVSYGRRGLPEVTTWSRTFAVDHDAYQQTSETKSSEVCKTCGMPRCE